MKRSNMIILGAAGVLAASALWPHSDPPEEPADALTYDSPSDCRVGGQLTAQECEQQFREASEQVLAKAPKFESQQDCETAYGAGRCRTATWNGASVFIPAMVGYMVARSLANGQTATQPLFPPQVAAAPCPPTPDPQLRPDCQPRQSSSSNRSFGYYSTGSGGTVVRDRSATGPSNAKAPKTAVSSPPSRPNVVSRGGFGSTARSISTTSSGT